MFRFSVLILSTLIFQAASAAAATGVVCTEDNLPDGNFQEYEVKTNANGKYDIVYRFEQGSMIDLPTGEVSEVVIATDMECTFGSKTPGLSSCQAKDAKGNVVAYFKTKLAQETYVDSVVPGKEYISDYVKISAGLPELKKNFQVEGYPEDADKNGQLYTDLLGQGCHYK